MSAYYGCCWRYRWFGLLFCVLSSCMWFLMFAWTRSLFRPACVEDAGALHWSAPASEYMDSRLWFSERPCASIPHAEEQEAIKALEVASSQITAASQLEYHKVLHSHGKDLREIHGPTSDMLVVQGLCYVGQRTDREDPSSFAYYLADQVSPEYLSNFLGVNFDVKPLSWLQTRKSIKLVPGKSFLVSLTQLERNPWHFFCRAAPLTLVNSAISPSELLTAAANGMDIDNLFLLTGPSWLPASFFREEGSLHNGFLRLFMEAAVTATVQRARAKKRVLRFNTSLPLCWEPGFELWTSTAKEEMQTVVTHTLLPSASEANPVCFEEVVIPCACCQAGFLRGGVAVAKEVQSRLLQQLGLPVAGRQPIAQGLKAAVLSRGTNENVSRTLNAADDRLLNSLVEEHFGATTNAVMGDLSFKSQVELVRSHQLLLGMHGAQLAMPSFIAPSGTVLFEIFPYFMKRGCFRDMACSVGLTYMSYELSASSPVAGDELFATTGHSSRCVMDTPCREHVKNRRVRLEDIDVPPLRTVLGLAKEIVSLDLDVDDPYHAQRLTNFLRKTVGCMPKLQVKKSCRHASVEYLVSGTIEKCIFLQVCT